MPRGIWKGVGIFQLGLPNAQNRRTSEQEGPLSRRDFKLECLQRAGRVSRDAEVTMARAEMAASWRVMSHRTRAAAT